LRDVTMAYLTIFLPNFFWISENWSSILARQACKNSRQPLRVIVAKSRDWWCIVTWGLAVWWSSHLTPHQWLRPDTSGKSSFHWL
jgi:hypothetical protein